MTPARYESAAASSDEGTPPMLPADYWAELAENRLADINALMAENSELRDLLRDVWRWGRTTELAERVEAIGALRTAGERE